MKDHWNLWSQVQVHFSFPLAMRQFKPSMKWTKMGKVFDPLTQITSFLSNGNFTDWPLHTGFRTRSSLEYMEPSITSYISQTSFTWIGPPPPLSIWTSFTFRSSAHNAVKSSQPLCSSTFGTLSHLILGTLDPHHNQIHTLHNWVCFSQLLLCLILMFRTTVLWRISLLIV